MHRNKDLMHERTEANGKLERAKIDLENLRDEAGKIYDNIRSSQNEQNKQILHESMLSNDKKIADTTKNISAYQNQVDTIGAKMKSNYQEYSGRESALPSKDNTEPFTIKDKMMLTMQGLAVVTSFVNPNSPHKLGYQKVDLPLETSDASRKSDKQYMQSSTRDYKSFTASTSSTKEELKKTLKDMEKKIDLLGDAREIDEERRKAARERSERAEEFRRKQDERKGNQYER